MQMILNSIPPPLILSLAGNCFSLTLFLFFAVFSRGSEKVLSAIVRFASYVYVALAISLSYCYLANDLSSIEYQSLLHIPFSKDHFSLSLVFDKVSAVFFALTVFSTVTILKFSRVYLHREDGYARFFSLLSLLTFGMFTLSIANNLDVLFIGWEAVGLASFFLISFYRHQERSVNSALRVFFTYRIGDLGLLFAALLVHFSFTHTATSTFSRLSASTLELSPTDPFFLFIIFGVFLATAIKSAQFPFTFWLPRAMEGPTPSSAIFYGALSVHVGCLLVIRLSPVLFVSDMFRMTLITMGVVTAVLATLSGRTQPTVKGQLAYASAAQVGLIMIEIALGFTEFALYHIVAHAMLRSYQLLTSPSALSEYSRSFQTETCITPTLERIVKGGLGKKLAASLWVARVNDFYCTSLFIHLGPNAFRKILGIVGIKAPILICVTVLVWLTSTAASPSHRALMAAGMALYSIIFAFFVTKRSASQIKLSAISLGLLTLSEYFLTASEPDHHSFVFFFAMILPAYFWILTYFSMATPVNDPKDFYDERRSSLWTVNILAAYLSCIPPSATYFSEHYLIHQFLGIAPSGALVAGLTYAINGMVLFRVSTKICKTREQKIFTIG